MLSKICIYGERLYRLRVNERPKRIKHKRLREYKRIRVDWALYLLLVVPQTYTASVPAYHKAALADKPEFILVGISEFLQLQGSTCISFRWDVVSQK